MTLETLKKYVLTVLGHSVSGGLAGVIYGLTDYLPALQTGGVSWSLLLNAALIGGSLGFLKAAYDTVEKIKAGTVKVQRKAVENKRKYFGL